MLYIDFETRSEADIREVGAWKYSRHPSTDILCMAYAIEDGPVQIWTPHENIPLEVKDYIEEGGLVEAHNIFFEKALWYNVANKKLNWPLIKEENWRCSLSVAAACAVPRSLEGCTEALGIIQKDTEGKRVMLQLSQPRKRSKANPDDDWWTEEAVPEKFEQLYQYCMTDVECEREIARTLPPLSKTELAVWQMDQTINMRGIKIDVESATAALKAIEEYTPILDQRVAKATKYKVRSATAVAQLLAWVNSRGVYTDSLDAGSIESLLQQGVPSDVAEVLRCRQEASKASTAKIKKMLSAADDDGRVRDCLMYHGASTGRWAGKMIQPQNLPSKNILPHEEVEHALRVLNNGGLAALQQEFPDISPMNVISSCIRGLIVADEGKELIVADYAAIEARVLAWVSGDDEALQMFRDGKDLYIAMASKVYHVPVEEVTKDQRFMGKQAILGCGYGMGAKKFVSMVVGYGVEITEAFAKKVVDTYRQERKPVQRLWYAVEDAAIKAVRYRGKSFSAGRCKWYVKGDFLCCELPSSRIIRYYQPELKPIVTPWGAEKDQLTFMGTNSYTRKWERQSTWGGTLVENICQAIARDIMAGGMYRLEKAGLPVVLTVHDEVVCEVEEGKHTVKEVEDILCQLPKSGWADGLPLEAEGWKGKRYRK